MIDRTYWDFRALVETKDPLHGIRLGLVMAAMDITKDVTLEPMTITNPVYLGAGHLEYGFPNEGRTPNSKANGRFSSLYKGKDSWRFFREPMRTLHELSAQGLTCQHLLCARFRPEGSRVKDLFPIFLVGGVDRDYRAFSARNAAASRDLVTYLEEVERQNALFRSLLE